MKYGPLRWELKQQYRGYEVIQHNIIMDVLGGWSRETETSIQSLVGHKANQVLEAMQKAVLSSSLNIARTFKVMIWRPKIKAWLSATKNERHYRHWYA